MLSFVVALLAGCTPQDTTLTNGGDEGPIVNGTGGMQIDPAEILITDCDPGYSKSMQFTITSIGDGDLVIYDGKIVADVADVFYFEEITDDITLVTGSSSSYSVVATLPDANPAEGQLRLRTNDPDNTTYTMRLRAWPTGYEPPDTGGVDTGGGDTGGGDSGSTTP